MECLLLEYFLYRGLRTLFRQQRYRKQAELKAIPGITFREVRTPTSLANGFVIGRYPQAEEAQAALTKLKARGLRSARVVTVRPRIQAQNIVIPKATAAWQNSLPGVRLPQGKRFTACTLGTPDAPTSDAAERR